jgi:hypothetical protein
MLTPSERNLLLPMMLRSRAGDYLDLIKLRSLVPIDVEDRLTGYKTRIVEVVFDPMQISETNTRFQAAGFLIPDEMNVIAVNDDGTILVWWGRLNSIFWLRKGKRISKGFDANLAFQDLGDLTRRFKFKNKKVELDQMIAHLKELLDNDEVV